jgi:molybdate transport repressor ModE-like protein
MQDSDWDDLRFFLAVARAGSLSGAAKRLKVNHSTVLRRLAGLDTKLGVRVYERRPGGYAMTQAGEALLEQLDGVEQQIEAAQRRVGGLDRKLSGTLRLTSTDTLIRGLLMPSLAEFHRRQPAIQLQVVVNNTFLSLTRREADVAVRPTNRPPENLVGRRVGRIQSAIYASKAYLAQRGRKKAWSDHDWVAPDETLAHLAQAKWMQAQIPAERIVARVDSLSGMTEAVRHGLGLGLLLCLNGDSERELLRLAEPDEMLDTQVWILTHPDLRHVARVKALTDFLYAELARSEFVLGAAAARGKPARRPTRRQSG